MTLIRKVSSVFFVVSGMLVGAWVYLDNLTPVTMHLFGAEIDGIPLALWLLLFFGAGTMFGLMVSAIQALRHQMHLQIMRKQLKALKQKSLTTAPR